MTNISKSLINWYSQHKRDLPWRNTKNPYFIWVSEIILQQTRVNRGIDYYYNFIDTLPDIDSLASADIDSVLKVWQGLGYYSRARNMHYTANYIVKNLNGKFPEQFINLKKLKGVGDYTAAAIASFSFNEAVPVVDGNVYRILARLYNIEESTQTSKGKKIFFEKANDLIDKNNPSEFNQAIMEFGSLQCTPTNPDCEKCHLKEICIAYNNHIIDQLPVKKQKVKVRNRYFNYLHIIYKDHIFLEQRSQNDIWKLLYQLPLIETKSKISIEELLNHNSWKNIFGKLKLEINTHTIEMKHILSHQKIYAKFYKIKVDTLNNYIQNNYIQVPINEIEEYSIPRLIDSYLTDVNK